MITRIREIATVLDSTEFGEPLANDCGVLSERPFSSFIAPPVMQFARSCSRIKLTPNEMMNYDFLSI